MSEISINIKNLLEGSQKYIFIAGAGCSIDAPSCLPNGKNLMEEFIRFSCAKSEIENILQLENLRFETLIEIIRNQLDNDLKILDFLEECDKPNTIHFFLASMIKKGHHVLTTNFDFLIEQALIQSNVEKKSILPLITESDYINFKNFEDLQINGVNCLFKIHGSTKNIIIDRDTRNYFSSLIKKIGSYKDEFSLFLVEPYKGVLFSMLLDKGTIVIMGYSGENDLDIIPILKRYHKFEKIIWINHVDNNEIKEKVFEINKNNNISSENQDKLNEMLIEIKNINPNIPLYRIDANTKNLIKNMMESEPITNSTNFSIDLQEWLRQNIQIPDMVKKYLIPHILYFNFERYDDAFRCGIRALDNIQGKIDKKSKHLILNNIGWIYYKQGNYSEAITNFQEALKIAKQLENLDHQIVYLNNLGEIYEIIKNFPEAIKLYQKATILAEKTSNLMENLRSINSIAEIYEEVQNYPKALSSYDEVINIAEKIGDLRMKAIVDNNIASLHFKQKNLDSALKHFQKSEKIFRRLKDFENLTISLNNIGTIYQEFGDFTIALEKFEDALKIDERFENKEGRALRLCKIGGLYLDQENYLKALDYFLEALTITQVLKNITLEMELLNKIGKSYYFIKDYKNAINSFKDGMRISDDSNNILMKSDFLNNIAGCYFMLLNYTEALKFAEESLVNLKLYGLGRSIKALVLKKKIMNIKNQIEYS